MQELPFIAILLSILTFGYTFWKDFRLEKRLKTIEEEQAKEKTAERIRRSKASSPYFVPSKDLFSYVTEQGEGSMGMWRVLGGNVLYHDRKEVSDALKDNDPVIFVIDNLGKAARKIRLSGDITGITLKQEPDMSDSRRRLFLKYPFVPVNRGKEQKIVFSFESEDGYDLTHIYQTRHGFFELTRIDPP